MFNLSVVPCLTHSHSIFGLKAFNLLVAQAGNPQSCSAASIQQGSQSFVGLIRDAVNVSMFTQRRAQLQVPSPECRIYVHEPLQKTIARNSAYAVTLQQCTEKKADKNQLPSHLLAFSVFLHFSPIFLLRLRQSMAGRSDRPTDGYGWAWVRTASQTTTYALNQNRVCRN